jgi:DNA helicase-2/ATP-dependent DNA helicase PcrA
MKQILINLQQDPKKITPGSVLARISAAKNELLKPNEVSTATYLDAVAQRAYEQYQTALQANNAMDFDDLLVNTVRLFQHNPDVLRRYQAHYVHLLVDEFQDTNTAQYALVHLLGQAHRRVFVVGDPDQSIYAFRGADYRNIKRFEHDFSPEVIYLEENYRSHQYILDAATAVIRHNNDHLPRRLYSQRKEGEKLVIHEAYDEREEAEYIVQTVRALANQGVIAEQDVAVMYRMNAQSRAIEEACIHAGMRYLLVGATRFYERKEIKDVLAYMRAIDNPDDWLNMSRIVNLPPRGIGKTTIDQLQNWADSLNESVWQALTRLYHGGDSPLSGRAKSSLVSFTTLMLDLLAHADKRPVDILDAILEKTGYGELLNNDDTPQGIDRQENMAELRRVTQEDVNLNLSQFLEKVALVADVDSLNGQAPDEAITLLTLHAAKGLEFPVVFIVGMEEGLIPHWRAQEDPTQMAEERRLLYVGLTRAKDRLFLTYAFRRLKWGSWDVSEPSSFLDYLPHNVTEGYAGGMAQAAQAAFQRETTWSPYADKIVRLHDMDKTSPHRQPSFRSGQQVFHPKFGDGIVIKATVLPDIEEVEVIFAKHGQKKIMADFLQPR